VKKLVKTNCKNCGTEFNTSPANLKRGKGKFCTVNCVKEYKNKLVKCKECGKLFKTYPSRVKKGFGKYCSRKCADKGRITKQLKVCQNCGKEFYARDWQIKNGKGKFCSFKCRSGLENNPAWLGGISFGKYCPKFNENLKERVRIFFERTCQICGLSEKDNGKKLAVHHVTYEKDSCCNNKIAMFVPLCRKCHTKTNWNRKYWENILFTYISLYFDGDSFVGQNDVVYYSGGD
jgi:hypothetical protein